MLRIKNPNIVFYIFLGLYFILMIGLSFLRDMIKDESLYFRETWLISELLKDGKWIGGYAVGLHGFLFKLPPAIIFMFTGPSVEIVTIYNILLSIGVGYFFYKITKEYLKKEWYAFFATVFMMVNFHFLLNTPTFMREIPSLLIILFFVYAVMKNWNQYWLSLIFVLLLDTKEYVFLIFVIFYSIWTFITLRKVFLKKILHLVIVFLPSFIWILLMFFTSIVPINMYLASILGLIDESLGYTLKHFDIDFTAMNLIEEGKSIPLISTDNISSPWLLFPVEVLNAILSIIGKILYPRTFSFLSVPKVIMFPVIFSSILVLKRFFKNKKGTKILVFSSFLILTWLIFYILRSSHGRYLLPIVPLISIMMIYTFFYAKFTLLQKKILLVGTGIFILLGVIFESSYILEKLAIELILFSILCFFVLKSQLEYLKYVFLCLLIVVSAGVSILFSYTQGQIHGYLNWGENREVEKLSEIIPDNSRYWINNYVNQNLVAVYEGETYASPEWKWGLDTRIKQVRKLSILGNKYGYNFDFYDLKEFEKTIDELEIEYVLFLSSDKEPFDDQEYLKDIVGNGKFELKKEVTLEGKKVTVFEVVN